MSWGQVDVSNRFGACAHVCSLCVDIYKVVTDTHPCTGHQQPAGTIDTRIKRGTDKHAADKRRHALDATLLCDSKSWPTITTQREFFATLPAWFVAK